MKECPYPSCDEEIFDWQKSCYLHKGIDIEKVIKEKQESEENKMNEQNTNDEQSNNSRYGNPSVSPEMYARSMAQGTYKGVVPEPPQFNPTPQPPPPYIVGQTQRMSQPQTQPQTQIKKTQGFELPELNDRDRMAMKQVAFKEAVNVFLSQDEQVSYDDMLGKIRRLSVDFYKIMVEKNEMM